MSDYDELTNHYEKHDKQTAEEVVKDNYQDQIPIEDESKNIPHGGHADHYDGHGEKNAKNTPKGDGSHADHYEDHGEETNETEEK